MKKISIILVLTILSFACKEVKEEVTEIKETTPMISETPFIHHVYFCLKNPSSAEDKAKLKEGLEFLATVPTIQKHYIGVPADTDREVIDNTYAFSWLCFFENAEDQATYQTDPTHLKFIEDYGSLWETVKVYDSVME
jgi:hypothetical protein